MCFPAALAREREGKAGWGRGWAEGAGAVKPATVNPEALVPEPFVRTHLPLDLGCLRIQRCLKRSLFWLLVEKRPLQRKSSKPQDRLK